MAVPACHIYCSKGFYKPGFIFTWATFTPKSHRGNVTAEESKLREPKSFTTGKIQIFLTWRETYLFYWTVHKLVLYWCGSGGDNYVFRLSMLRYSRMLAKTSWMELWELSPSMYVFFRSLSFKSFAHFVFGWFFLLLIFKHLKNLVLC